MRNHQCKETHTRGENLILPGTVICLMTVSGWIRLMSRDQNEQRDDSTRNKPFAIQRPEGTVRAYLLTHMFIDDNKIYGDWLCVIL
jgi:hypothetical protein